VKYDARPLVSVYEHENGTLHWDGANSVEASRAGHTALNQFIKRVVPPSRFSRVPTSAHASQTCPITRQDQPKPTR
jgi:hypothetical protein